MATACFEHRCVKWTEMLTVFYGGEGEVPSGFWCGNL